MTMKIKNKNNKFFPKIKFDTKTLIFAVVLLIESLFAYFCNAGAGLVSTIPVWFIILAAVLTVCDFPIVSAIVSFVSGTAFSLVLGQGILKASLYGLGYAVFTGLAFFTAKFFRDFLKKKRKQSLAVSAGMIVAGLIMQYFYAGTLVGIIKAESRVSDYLANKYINQEFTEIDTSYDVGKGKYVSSVAFKNGENTLWCDMIVYDEIEDGFYPALSEWALIKQKDKMITALKSTDKIFECFVEEKSMNLPEQSQTITFKYGDDNVDDMAPLMNYTITMKKPVTQIRIFAARCRNVFQKLSDVNYGSIEVFGCNENGEKIFTCTLTKDVKIGDILSLCKNLSEN